MMTEKAVKPRIAVCSACNHPVSAHNEDGVCLICHEGYCIDELEMATACEEEQSSTKKQVEL